MYDADHDILIYTCVANWAITPHLRVLGYKAERKMFNTNLVNFSLARI